MKRWTAQEHADHICRVLGLDVMTANLSGLAAYLETHIFTVPGDLRQEWENRAGIIVRGTADSSSGWYNSPDYLTAVIAVELAAAYAIGRKQA
jgi:hypothetical protein